MRFQKDDVLGAGIIVSALAAIGLAAIAAGRNAPPLLAADTHCPIDKAPTEHVIVLVDRTDAFSRAHLELLRRRMTDVRGSLSTYGRLSIHMVGADPYAAQTPALDLCNPGDAGSVNGFWRNRDWQQEDFEAAFNAPLDLLLADLEAAETAEASPLLESIALAAEMFDPHVVNRRMIIVSDLMEHEDALSHYRSPPSASAMRQTLAFDLMSDGRLDGVAVAIVYLRRRSLEGRQTSAHLEAWRTIFAEAGARLEQHESERRLIARQD